MNAQAPISSVHGVQPYRAGSCMWSSPSARDRHRGLCQPFHGPSRCAASCRLQDDGPCTLDQFKKPSLRVTSAQFRATRVRFAGVSLILLKAQANLPEPKRARLLANKSSSCSARSVKRPRTGRTHKPEGSRCPPGARMATFRRPRPRWPQTSYTVLYGYKRARMLSPAYTTETEENAAQVCLQIRVLIGTGTSALAAQRFRGTLRTTLTFTLATTLTRARRRRERRPPLHPHRPCIGGKKPTHGRTGAASSVHRWVARRPRTSRSPGRRLRASSFTKGGASSGHGTR
ncbi:hypothetical protein C2E23DRAFT_87339 [Lenzites betulinus]|nr:hypothetical protein C2E23DRAFT_87339 [Lenzites betulinus]